MFAVNVQTTAAEPIHSVACTAVCVLNVLLIVKMLQSSSRIVLSFSDV